MRKRDIIKACGTSTTRAENSEFMSSDDLLRDALVELREALMYLYKVIDEGENHVKHNSDKTAEHVMKAGRIIMKVRGE